QGPQAHLHRRLSRPGSQRKAQLPAPPSRRGGGLGCLHGPMTPSRDTPMHVARQQAAPRSTNTEPTCPEAMFRLDDPVAIVTGASSGLGERFARVLQAAGASVVIAARRLDRLEALANGSETMLPVQCDVSVPDDVDGLVRTTVERFGRIDIVVNNAGINDPV